MSFLYKKRKSKRKRVHISSYHYDKQLVIYDSNVYICNMDDEKFLCGHVVTPIDNICYGTDLEAEIIDDKTIYIYNACWNQDEIEISCSFNVFS